MQSSKLKVKSLLVALLIVLGVTFILPTKAYAIWPFDIFTKNSATGSQTKFPNLVQKIIDKFNLNSGEVEKVMVEERTERKNEMRARREAKLDEAVKAGVITSEQKTALLNKEDEWQNQQQQRMQERQQWMEQSGIDFEKLASYGGPAYRQAGLRGRGGFRGKGPGSGW